MEKQKIAVIGSGISGISSCLFLSNKYEVNLFEKNNYIGGHTRTVKIKNNNTFYEVDTGFIVFNNHNYPDLVDFFKYLNIETKNSNMSLSICTKNPNLEYGSSLGSLFAQKKNIFSFKFFKLIKEIISLYNHCKKIHLLNDFESLTIEDFLTKFNYSDNIKNCHIYPIISSIWSCNKKDVKQFPLISFINFFNNHKLFNFFNRQQWKYIEGGSYQYIKSILSKNLFKYNTNKCVKTIVRSKNKVLIIFNDDEKFIADKVILATHADQALKLINDPDTNEVNILSKFNYSKNLAYLHTDQTFMPKSRSAWSSWNFKVNNYANNSFSITYWMNLLQNIKSKNNFFVSINPHQIPKGCYDQTIFEHPIFNLDTLQMQKKINQIQGKNKIWFCGSYCGHGFHEDGIQSAAYVANLLNVSLPWKREKNFYNRLQY